MKVRSVLRHQMETVALMRRKVDSPNGDLGKLGASAKLFPRAPGCDTKGAVIKSAAV